MKRSEDIRKYWETEETISLADDNLRQLEVQAILASLEAGDNTLDLGCGDGINTAEFAGRVRHILGVDYSKAMVEKAERRRANLRIENARFQLLEAGEIETLEPSFDVVITQRCLINMVDLSEQVRAIRSVHRLLKPGGRYLMLECIEDGRVALNELRERMGLEPIPMPWHNRFFQRKELDGAVADLFSVKATVDFSLYYLLSRILTPSMGLMPMDPFCKRIDDVSRQMASKLGLVSKAGIGPQCLFVLIKKR